MAEAYQSWQDLCDDVAPAPSGPAVPAASESARTVDDLLAMDGVPEDLKHVLRERQALRRQLDVLTGKAPEAEIEERDAKRFPVKVHTKESRLEEKRLRRLEEIRDEAAKRAAERQRLEEERLRRETRLKAEQQRRARLEQALNDKLARLRDLARQAALQRQRADALRQTQWQETRRRLAAELVADQRRQNLADEADRHAKARRRARRAARRLQQQAAEEQAAHQRMNEAQLAAAAQRRRQRQEQANLEARRESLVQQRMEARRLQQRDEQRAERRRELKALERRFG